MAQASGTKTGSGHTPPVRRRRRGLEVGGLVIGILAGLGITLGWLISTRGQPPRPHQPGERDQCDGPHPQPELGPAAK